jgi:hypothetical protein
MIKLEKFKSILPPNFPPYTRGIKVFKEVPSKQFIGEVCITIKPLFSTFGFRRVDFVIAFVALKFKMNGLGY